MPRSKLAFKPDGEIGEQWPRVCSFPPYDRTFGPEAVELAAQAGLVLDPWQCNVLDVMLAVRPDGKWSCFELGLVVPRQNGKGSILEARTLAGLVLFDEQLIMWSAHEYKTAMEGFRRLRDLIDGRNDLTRRVKKIVNTHGEEGIEMRSGQRVRFLARSKGSGRGFSGDLDLNDEWFAGTRSQVAAKMPTLSARPNPQLVYTSSPPLDSAEDEEGPGDPLYALRERGEAGDDPALGWFDWSAPLNPDKAEDRLRIGEHDQWKVSNPAYGIRIHGETIEREMRSMGAKDFMRERLCVWPRRALGANLIDPKQWGSLADPESVLGDNVAFAVDITPGRDYCAIVAYGEREDGMGHIEVIDHRGGSEWVLERLVELRDRWNPVGIGLDPRGPAASLLVDLEREGFELAPRDLEECKRGQLAVMSTMDVAAATGQIIDAVMQATTVHRDQHVLNAAVIGAKTRPLGDGMAWARRLATVDISALCGATIARWVYVSRIDYVRDEYNPDSNIW